MKKYSQKPTSLIEAEYVSKDNQQALKQERKLSSMKRELVSKLEAMSENIERVEPLFIPGYKIRG